jgi:hypothetical protein
MDQINDSKIVRTGGDSPRTAAALTPGVEQDAPIGRNIVAQGFLFSTDGEFDVVTADGDTVNFPPGTHALFQQHSLMIKTILASSTAIGFLYR